MTTDPENITGYASAPCFAHELSETAEGFAAVDRQTAIDVARWRKAKREELIAARLANSAARRTAAAEAVGRQLDQLIGPGKDTIVSLYWPFRGELDLCGWMRSAYERGARIALPVVVNKAHPLLFREWTPEGTLTRGVWNIPIPADGAKVVPNVVISPLVGYDPDNFRLGYGGGFFDRTLAAMTTPRRVIGVGQTCGALATIFPQPHDIAMDQIVVVH